MIKARLVGREIFIYSATSILLLALSLWIFRFLYGGTGLASVVLAPMFLFTFLGSFLNQYKKRQAHVQATIQAASPLYWLLSGKVVGLAISICVTLILVTIVAYHVVVSEGAQLYLVMPVIICAATAYVVLMTVLQPHANPKVLSWYSATLAVVFGSALVFVPVVWVELKIVERPEYLLKDYPSAVASALKQLPLRNDVINEIMSVLVTLDASRLWLATNFAESELFGVGATMLYALHSAMICVAAATVTTSICSAAWHFTSGLQTPIPKVRLGVTDDED
jgi:hypothetical protein